MHNSRFYLGLILGLAVGALAGRWLTLALDEPMAVSAAHSSGSASMSPGSSTPKVSPAKLSATVASTTGPTDAVRPANWAGSAKLGAQDKQNTSHLDVRQDPAAPIMPPAESAGHRASDRARGSSSSPIAVPEVLKDILTDVPDIERPMSIEEAHRAISAQPKDESWAYAMEQNIRQFFADHPYGSTFDIWLAECRESFCELQGGNFDAKREEIVKQVMIELQQQPWIDSVSSTWSSSSSSDGVLYFAYIMNWSQRNPQPSP